MISRKRIWIALLASSLCSLATFADEPKVPVKPGGDDSETVVLRGKVVDIKKELQRAHTIDIGAGAEPLLGFKTADGKIYTLLKSRRSEALFMDQRLHSRELIIKCRLFKNTQVVEATFFQSVKKGVIHELYYYCDICAIKSITPEICACCNEPVRLVEEPVARKKKSD
jgi:hypothetical protein